VKGEGKHEITYTRIIITLWGITKGPVLTGQKTHAKKKGGCVEKN